MTGLHPWWPDAAPAWLHPHLVFELLGYAVGFRTFLWFRRRRGDPVGEPQQRLTVIVAAAMGAALGSRLLGLAEDPAFTQAMLAGDPGALLTARTIVGGLLGGWIAVEATKKVVGVRVSTGDLYAIPLCVGMIVGRVGCFLSGVTDGTHGVETAGWWGMDLGDGLARHPTALYEIGVLSGLGALLASRRWPPGFEFQLFLWVYLMFRLVIEPLKTQPAPYLGLSAIQLACAAALIPSTIRLVALWRARVPA